MRATIVESIQLSIGMSGHDDGAPPKTGSEEITGLGHLALVPEIQPAAAENLLLLPPIEIRGIENLAADEAGLDVDERLKIAHALTPLYVLIIVAFNGLLRPSDHGVRTALVAHIVPSEQLIGALAVARTTIDSNSSGVVSRPCARTAYVNSWPWGTGSPPI